MIKVAQKIETTNKEDQNKLTVWIKERKKLHSSFLRLIGYKNKKQKIVPGSLFFNLDDYSQFATKNDMELDDDFIPEEANLDNLEPPRKKAGPPKDR